MGIFNYIELTKDVVKIFPNWNLVSTPVKIHWILDGFYGSEINILGDRSALGTFMNERTIIPPFSDATLDELEKHPNKFNFIRLNRQNVLTKFKNWNDDNISVSIKVHWILEGCEGPRIFSIKPSRRNRIEGDLKLLSNFLNLRNILPDVTKFDFIEPLTVQIELVSEEDKHIIISDVKLQELSNLSSFYTKDFEYNGEIIDNNDYGSIRNSPINHLCYDDLYGNNIISTELDNNLIMLKITNIGESIQNTTRIVPFRGYKSKKIPLFNTSYNLYWSSFNGINKPENVLDIDLNTIWETKNSLYNNKVLTTELGPEISSALSISSYKGYANLLNSKKNQLVNIFLPNINSEFKKHPNIDLNTNENESYIVRTSSNFNYFEERLFDSGNLINIGELEFKPISYNNEESIVKNVISHWVLDFDKNIIIGYNIPSEQEGGLRMCKITQLGNNILNTSRFIKLENGSNISNQYEFINLYYSKNVILSDNIYSFIKSDKFSQISMSEPYYAFDGNPNTQWKSSPNRYNKGDNFFSLNDFEYLSKNSSSYLNFKKTEIGTKIFYNEDFSEDTSQELYRFYYKNPLPNECNISWNFEANNGEIFLLLTNKILENWDSVNSLVNLLNIDSDEKEVIGWTSHYSSYDRICNINPNIGNIQFENVSLYGENFVGNIPNKGGREIKIQNNGTLQASLTNLDKPSQKIPFKRKDNNLNIENTGNWYLYGAIIGEKSSISELVLNIDGVYTKKPTILPSLELIPINLPEESTNSTNSTNVINNIDLIDFNLELEGTNSSIFFPYVFNENTSPIRIKSNILDEINSNNISIELVATLVNPLSPCTIFNIIDSSQKNNFKLELEFNSENELSLLFSWIKEENNDNILTWRNSILPLNIGQQTHFVFIIDTINNDVSMICDGQNILASISNENSVSSNIIGNTDYITIGGLDTNYLKNINKFDLLNYKNPKYVNASSGNPVNAFDNNSNTLWLTSAVDDQLSKNYEKDSGIYKGTSKLGDSSGEYLIMEFDTQESLTGIFIKKKSLELVYNEPTEAALDSDSNTDPSYVEELSLWNIQNNYYSCSASSERDVFQGGNTSYFKPEYAFNDDAGSAISRFIWTSALNSYINGFPNTEGEVTNLGIDSSGNATADGEYIIFNMPYSRKLKGIKISRSSNGEQFSPKKWKVYGKTKSSHWEELIAQNNTIPGTIPDGGTTWELDSPTEKAYSSFALVIEELNTANDFAATVVEIEEIKFLCMPSEEFKIYARNNNTENWDIIHSEENTNITNDGKYFVFDQINKYKYYGLIFTNNQGYYNLEISEIKLICGTKMDLSNSSPGSIITDFNIYNESLDSSGIDYLYTRFTDNYENSLTIGSKGSGRYFKIENKSEWVSAFGAFATPDENNNRNIYWIRQVRNNQEIRQGSIVVINPNSIDYLYGRYHEETGSLITNHDWNIDDQIIVYARQYPYVKMASNSQNSEHGLNFCFSSTNSSSSFHVFDGNNDTIWESSNTFLDTSGGLYNGTSSQDGSGGILESGEWISYELPKSIVLWGIIIVADNENLDSAPCNFKVYGSNDLGIPNSNHQWEELLSIENANPAGLSNSLYNRNGTLYQLTSISSSYKHFNLLINKTVNSSSCKIVEIQYIGIETEKDWKVEDNLGNYGEYLELELSQPAVINEIKITSVGELEISQNTEHTNLIYNWDNERKIIYPKNSDNQGNNSNNYFESNTNIHNQVTFTVKNGNNWIVGLKSSKSNIVLSGSGIGQFSNSSSQTSNDEVIEEFKFEANGSNCFVKDASGEKIISSDSYYFNDNLLQIIVDKASSKVRFWMNGNKLHEYDVSYIGDWYIFAYTDENSVIDFVSSNSFRKDFKIFGKKKPINPKNYKLKIIGSGSGGAFVVIAEIKLQNIDTGEYIILTNPTASSIWGGGYEADKAIDGSLETHWHSLSRNGNGSSIENIWWKADVTLESNASYRIYVTGRHKADNESSPVIVRLFDSNDETTILAESPILTHYIDGSYTQETAEWEFMTRTDEENWIEIHSENGVSISHNGSNFSFDNNISYDIYSLVITSNDSLPTYDSFVWKNEVNIASEDNSDASGTGHYNYLSEYAFFNRVSLSEVKFLEKYTVEDNGNNPIDSEDGKYFYINKDSFISAFGYGTPKISDSNWGNTIYIVKQLRNDGNEIWSGEILIHWWESYGIGRKNNGAPVVDDWKNNDEIVTFGTQYPTESLDSINQNGYKITISDGLDENNAYKLFSRQVFEDTLQVWNIENYDTSGVYIGTSNIGLDNNGFPVNDYGEWIILEMPVPLNLKAFIVNTGPNGRNGLEFSIYGSNDKKKWEKIEYNNSNLDYGLYEIFKIIEEYSYFGFVVTNILNSITNIQYFGSLITEVDYGEYINLENDSKEIISSIKIGDYSNNTSILENFSYPSSFKVYGSKEIVQEDDSPYYEYSAGSMYLGDKFIHPLDGKEYSVNSSSYNDEYSKIEKITYKMPDMDTTFIFDISEDQSPSSEPDYVEELSPAVAEDVASEAADSEATASATAPDPDSGSELDYVTEPDAPDPDPAADSYSDPDPAPASEAADSYSDSAPAPAPDPEVTNTLLLTVIYVGEGIHPGNSGNEDGTSPFRFYSDESGIYEVEAKIYKSNEIYQFKRVTGISNDHPFYISDKGYEEESQTLIFSGDDSNHNSGITGSQSFIMNLNNYSITSSIYYYCTAHSEMMGIFDYVESDPASDSGSGADAGADPESDGGAVVDPASDPESDGGAVADAGADPESDGGAVVDPASDPESDGGAVADPESDPESAPEPAPTVIYVDGGNHNGTYGVSGFYNFFSDSEGTVPVYELCMAAYSYEFRRLGEATSHPFYISDKGYEEESQTLTFSSEDGNPTSGITGSQSFIMYLNGISASSSIYYYCTEHSEMMGKFNLVAAFDYHKFELNSENNSAKIVLSEIPNDGKMIIKYRMWAAGLISSKENQEDSVKLDEQQQKTDSLYKMPTDWHFQGSNDDGLTWTTIHSVVGYTKHKSWDTFEDLDAINIEEKPYSEFYVDNPGIYKQYRLFILKTRESINANNNNEFSVIVGDLRFYNNNNYSKNVLYINNKWKSIKSFTTNGSYVGNANLGLESGGHATQYGEYLTIELPQKGIVSNIKLVCSENMVYDIIYYASNDNISWTLIAVSTWTWVDTNGYNIDLNSNDASYKYYGLVFTSAIYYNESNSVNNTNIIYYNESNSANNPSLRTSAFESYLNTPNNPPSNENILISDIIHCVSIDKIEITTSKIGYSGSDYSYSGDGTSRAGYNTDLGEYKIYPPNEQTSSKKIKLNSLKIISKKIENGPKDFKIYGSTDRFSWTEILDVINASPVTSGSIYYFDNNTDYYDYFAIVVKKLVNSEKLDIEEIIFYSEPWELLYYWNIGNIGIDYYSIPLFIENNEEEEKVIEHSLPYTFTNSEFLSIKPIQIGPGMSYEMSYIFNDENSTNINEVCLFYMGNEFFDGQWYRIIRSNNGNIIDIIVRTSGNNNSNDWQYRQTFDTKLSNIHLVWIIHEDGYGASIYINGQPFSKDLGFLEKNTTLGERKFPLFLETPEMISLGGNWESGKKLGDSNPDSVLTKFKIYNKVLSATEVLKQYEEYSIKSASLTHKIDNNNDYIAFGLVILKSNSINNIDINNEKVYYNVKNLEEQSNNVIINELEIDCLGEKIDYSELFGPINSQSDLINYYSFGTIESDGFALFNPGIYFNLENPILNTTNSEFINFDRVNVSSSISGHGSNKSIDKSLDTFYKSEKDGINTWTGTVQLPIYRSKNYRLSVIGSLEENVDTGNVRLLTKDSNGNLLKDYGNLTYYNHGTYNQMRDSMEIDFVWTVPEGREIISQSLLCKYTSSLVNSIESSKFALIKSYYGVLLDQEYDLDKNYIEISNELTTDDPEFMTTNSGFVFINDTNNFDLDTNWTFSLWVRIKPTENRLIYLFNNNNTINGLSFINIALNQDADETSDLGKLTIQFRNSNGEYSINKSNIIPSCDLRDNNWHHICLLFEYNNTVNIRNVKLYIDKKIQDSTTDNSLEYLQYTGQINGSFNNDENDSFFSIGNRGSTNLSKVKDRFSVGNLDIRNISFFDIVINYEELGLLYNEEYMETIELTTTYSSAYPTQKVDNLKLELFESDIEEKSISEEEYTFEGQFELGASSLLEEKPVETIPSYVMNDEVKYGTTNYIMSKPEIFSKSYIISKPKSIRYNRRHIVYNEKIEPWIIFGTNDYSLSSEESGHWSINNTSKFVGILYDISESDELTILNNEIFLFTDGYNNSGKINGFKTKYIDGNINNHLKIQFKKDSNIPENVKIQVRGIGNQFMNKYIHTLFFTIKADTYSNLKSYNHSRVSTYDGETISISLINGDDSGFGPLVYKWSAIQTNLSLYKFTINKISNRFNDILDGISLLIEPQPEPEPEFMEPEPEPEFMESEPEPEPEIMEPEPECELIPRVEFGTRGFVYDKIFESLKYVKNASIYIGRLFCDLSNSSIYLFSDGYNEIGEYDKNRIPYTENNIENHIEIKFNEDIGDKSIQIKAIDPKFNNKYIHTLYFSVNSGDYSMLDSKNHTGFVRNSRKIFLPGNVSIDMIGYTDINRNDSPQVYKWETMQTNKDLYETTLNKTTNYFSNILDRISILSKENIMLNELSRKSKIEFGTHELEIFTQISELPRTKEEHKLVNILEGTTIYIGKVFKLIQKDGSIQRKDIYLFKDGYNYSGYTNEKRMPYTKNDINNNIIIRIKNLRTIQIKAIGILFENCYIDTMFFNVDLNIKISSKNHVGVKRGKINISKIKDSNRFRTKNVYKWKNFETNIAVCEYSVNKITNEYTDILDRIDIGTLG